MYLYKNMKKYSYINKSVIVCEYLQNVIYDNIGVVFVEQI